MKRMNPVAEQTALDYGMLTEDAEVLADSNPGLNAGLLTIIWLSGAILMFMMLTIIFYRTKKESCGQISPCKVTILILSPG